VAKDVKFRPKFKLNHFKRQEALGRLNAGESMSDVARSFAVHHSTISRLAAASPFEHGAVGL
jgi:hypothetical protein